MQFPSAGATGRAQAGNRSSSGAFPVNEPVETGTYDPLIGRKVWTRWPEDNHFYEAVITDFNPIEVCSDIACSLLCTHLTLDLLLILYLHNVDRDVMHWFMILTQQMKHGNGSISKRYDRSLMQS